MKKFFLYFWLLFIFYFVFVHAAIIYYAGADYSRLQYEDGKKALIYVAISIVLWLIIFTGLFLLIYKVSFKARKNIKYILENGTLLKSEVIKSENLPSAFNGVLRKKVTLSLNNVPSVPVKYTTEINDSKPELNRFAIGKHLNLYIDKSFKKNPYVALEGVQPKISYRFYIIWLIFILAIIGYYIVVYRLENHGYGWRFFSMGHPLFITPLIVFGLTLILWLVFIKLLGKYFGKGKVDLKLLFTGIRTTGEINAVSQTGVQVNDQPQVKFDITFYDKFVGQHNIQIKRIVSLLDLANVSSLKHIDIFYLPDNPTIARLAEDVE